MTKAELIEKMAKDAGVSKVAAGKALDSFCDGVTKALKKKNGKVIRANGTNGKVNGVGSSASAPSFAPPQRVSTPPAEMAASAYTD